MREGRDARDVMREGRDAKGGDVRDVMRERDRKRNFCKEWEGEEGDADGVRVIHKYSPLLVSVCVCVCVCACVCVCVCQPAGSAYLQAHTRALVRVVFTRTTHPSHIHPAIPRRSLAVSPLSESFLPHCSLARCPAPSLTSSPPLPLSPARLPSLSHQLASPPSRTSSPPLPLSRARLPSLSH